MSQMLQSISEVTSNNTDASVDVENNKNKHNKDKSKVPSISYSKDFLLGLQYAPSSLVKPDLPNLHFLSDRLSISNRRESCPAVVPTNNWRLRSPSSSDCHSPLSSSPVTSSYFNAYYQKSNSSSLRAAVESAKIKRLQRTRPYSESTVQEVNHTSLLNNRCAS